MAGQSITDRVMAAKHSIAGQGLSKSVFKATTEEVMGPKRKHLDYLLHCTNEPNVSIPQLANLLIDRTQQKNWVVVFKSLITIHNLMNYGNERFTQFLASNNCSFNLDGFIDKNGVQGYDMSTFIRRYAKYLDGKAISYRTMAFDFCKVKRGADGMLRTMTGEKLLKALPCLQTQVDSLLEFDCSPNDLTNGVINAAFMLLFKDLIRLFACYNDGIINLLEKYFEMNKKQCREALEIYKRFLVRMERVSEFLKVAENVGIDKGDIPDLAKAPSSLLEALEAHLAALEAQKKSGGAVKTPTAVNNVINDLAKATDSSARSISEAEKKRALEEEKRHLEQLKEQRVKAGDGELSPPKSNNPFEAPIELSSPSKADPNLFGAPVASNIKPSDDLLGLGEGASFGGAAPAANNPFANPGAWASAAPAGPPPQQQQPATVPVTNTTHNSHPPTNGASDFARFDAVFGSAQNNTSQGQVSAVNMVTHTSNPPPGFDGFGEVMRPAGQPATSPMQPIMGGGLGTPKKEDPKNKLISGDLDSSLASLAGNLNFVGAGLKKTEHDWKGGGSQNKGLTGGTGWAGNMNPPAAAPGMPAQPVLNGYSQPYQPFSNGQASLYGQPHWGSNNAAPMGMMGYQQQHMRMQQPGAFGGPANNNGAFGQSAAPSQQPNDPFGAL